MAGSSRCERRSDACGGGSGRNGNAVDFRSLPDRPDHPRYLKRLKEISSLLKSRRERLVEEGMLMDRATADDDFHWFCKRFTSFETYRITERGHPLNGGLWIDHPYSFWLCRLYQEWLVEPQDGWCWAKMHRLGLKTTTLLALCLWVHSIDEASGDYPATLGLSRTIGLWTHKADEIGTGMGRGLLAEIQTEKLRLHYPQFRNLREGTKQGYVVDRPPGPREQSLLISSILTSPESVHPDIYMLDDVVTARLQGNVEQIAKISKNISAIATLMTPDCPVLVCNTPKDKADPLIVRERDGLFACVVSQAATFGGAFTPAGEANLHTQKFYERRRKEIANDSIYYAEYELEFRESSATLFNWAWMIEYSEAPEMLARRSPYINIIVDGAKGKEKSDFTVVRVITWTAHNKWANLDLIRERIGVSKTMQILLGRDETDPTSNWIADWYCPGGVGLVEKWMRIDPQLTIWFDDHANSSWIETFEEKIRERRIRFSGGKRPTIRKWPEVHRSRSNVATQERSGYTKLWKIQQLETAYQDGRVAYPKLGFRHGCYNGMAGGRDMRDTLIQFREDEFERLALGEKLAYDDMLDTEAVVNMPKAQSAMRRPQKGVDLILGGVEYPRATIENPWGIPGGVIIPGNMPTGKTWVSL